MADDELQAQLAALAARLQTVEDVEAIRQLHHRFTKAVADRRFGTLAGHFTDDAVIDMRRHGETVGRDALEQHFAGMAAQPLTGAGYVLSSPVIAVADDAATGEWTWHRFFADSEPGRGSWEEGRYRCAYRRTEDGWRFSRMHFRVVLPVHDDGASDQ
ncbi:MAG: hypothetical protein JWO46_2113 [Nocardioidaceae bacterium]|nr:hypothetical protein [Nocardioidaceae bacterium]